MPAPESDLTVLIRETLTGHLHAFAEKFSGVRFQPAAVDDAIDHAATVLASKIRKKFTLLNKE